jgi:hypothetical protein
MSGSKTIVIGSTGHAHVASIPWEKATATNLVDYDVVVVDCSRLTTQYLDTFKYDFFDRIRYKLARLMASGGKIIALGIAEQRTPRESKLSHDTYSWSPVGITTVAETGDTVTLIDAGDFGRLLSLLKRWSFWYKFGGDLSREFKSICGEISEVDYTRQIVPIALNRYGEVLAGQMYINAIPKNSRDEDDVKSLGPIVLLPPIEGLPAREAVNLVLEDLLGLPQETLPPEWAAAIEVPGIGRIEQDINGKQAEIDSLVASVADLGVQRVALDEYKKLLYASGAELERIFAQCLEELGATINPPRYSTEEFVLEYEGTIRLVECKGVGKSAAASHLRQLWAYISKYEEDEERDDGKGILFVNAWNEVAPDERDMRDTPVFPQNVIDPAVSSHVALVSSVAFFRAFCRFLEGKCTADEILRKILDTSGVVRFE